MAASIHSSVDNFEVPTDPDHIANMTLEQIRSTLERATEVNGGVTIQSLVEEPIVDASNAAAGVKRDRLMTLLPLIDRHQQLDQEREEHLKAAQEGKVIRSTTLVGIRPIDWSAIPKGTLPILAFPIEVQDKIFSYAFQRSEPVWTDTQLNNFVDYDESQGSGRVLHTCRYLYNRYIRTFLSMTTFTVNLRNIEQQYMQTHYVESFPYCLGNLLHFSFVESVVIENPQGGFDHAMRLVRAFQDAIHRKNPLKKVTIDMRIESSQFSCDPTLTIEEPASERVLQLLNSGGVKTDGLEITVLESWHTNEKLSRTDSQRRWLEPALERALERGADGLTPKERKIYLREFCGLTGRQNPLFIEDWQAQQAATAEAERRRIKLANKPKGPNDFAEAWAFTQQQFNDYFENDTSLSRFDEELQPGPATEAPVAPIENAEPAGSRAQNARNGRSRQSKAKPNAKNFARPQGRQRKTIPSHVFE